MLKKIVPYLGYSYLSVVGNTSRVEWVRSEIPHSFEKEGRNFIYAFWHGRQIPLICTHRRRKVCAMASRSADGQHIAKILELSGLKVVRGSSSRGGASALKQILEQAAGGFHPGVAPDGPRGPAREVKHGVLFMAQKLGIPIIPLSTGMRTKIVFRGWDDYCVPLPFNKISVVHSTPITVGPDDSLEEKARELKEALDNITAEADRRAAAGVAGKIIFCLYNLAFPVLAIGFLASILASNRRRILRGLPREFWERLGWLGREEQANRRKTLWFHAASVGEINSMARLLPLLREKLPHFKIMATTSTQAGKNRAQAIFGKDFSFLAPLDFYPITRKALDRIKPIALIVVETELWPGLIKSASKSGAKVILLNGRISRKSMKGYTWIRPLLRDILARIDLFCVQTDADAQRFINLGAPPERVTRVGNLKYDISGDTTPTHESSDVEIPDIRRRTDVPDMPPFLKGKKVFVAGSTHEGEETAILDAFLEASRRHPSIRLVLAPRHTERCGSVLNLLKQKGIDSVLFSQVKRGHALRQRRRTNEAPEARDALRTTFSKDAACVLVDQVGQLFDLYRMAHVVFVGGSLVPKGCHNLLEPAILKKPVIFGPHTETVEEVAKALESRRGGFRVSSTQDLAALLDRLLSSEEMIRQVGQSAWEICQGFKGSTERTLQSILPILR